MASGLRVEINAFTSDQLIAWIESKLGELGISKVVPNRQILTKCYREAVRRRLVAKAVATASEEAARTASKLAIPKSLRQSIEAALKADPALPWDRAVAEMVEELQ